MPTTDFHDSSSSSSSLFGFSILSRRRDQIQSMESSMRQEIELDAFQRNVAVRFHNLSSPDSGEFLSIPWLRNLLDAFLCCQEEFKVILHNNAANLNKPQMEKPLADYFERSVKALDVCNAIRDGIQQIKKSQKQLEIVLCALDNNQRSIGEGQFRRAKKALTDLAIGSVDEKVSNTSFSYRNRSFGRYMLQQQREQRSSGHCRSLSWSVSRSWSAAKQLQAISSNLIAPKANEVTYGLNLAVFTMSYVLFFVMWALVAAIPCHDRGLQTHFSAMKQFSWGGPVLSLHERIVEESKKRERKNACGLLKEIYEVDKCARNLNELADSVQLFPLTEDKEREVKQRVEEVRNAYEGVKNGVDPLERQVREVFRRIVRSRTEGLDSIGR